MKRLTYFAASLALVIAAGTGVRGASHDNQDDHVAWLGVYTQSVDKDLADGFKLPVKSGAIINRVVEDSPADQAGLMDNDIVVEIDGTAIETADDLTAAIRKHDVGDVVNVKVLRDGKEREFSVTLSEREQSPRLYGRDFNFDSPDVPDAQTFKFYSAQMSDSYIGVELTSLSDQLKTYFGVDEDAGVLISSVEKDSPAEKAGLKAGDVIVKADGKAVAGAEDIQEVIRDLKEGDKVSLGLIRDHKTLTVSVEVAQNKSRPHALRAFTLPDMGKVPSPDLPRMRGLWFGTRGENGTMDDLRDELKSLHEQMNDLKQQLEDLKASRK